jgi:hypothetical protein
MTEIRTHAQKKKTKASKNTVLGVKKEKGILPEYKIKKESQIENLRDPNLNPNTNRSLLTDYFLDDYDEFLRFFLNTYTSIPYKKFNKFLTSWRFNTFQKSMSTRQRGNRRRENLSESDLDMESKLRWNMFLDNFENMLEGLEEEFRDIATELLRPNMHMFKKMLDLDRKNKGLKPFRDSFLTQKGAEWVNY